MTTQNVELAKKEPWRVLLIEDNQLMREQVHEEFDGEQFDGRLLDIHDVDDFAQARAEIQQRKVDLVILDVFRGDPMGNGKPEGLEVLEDIRKSGFVSVVLYTANPRRVEGCRSAFIRLSDKPVADLRREVDELFSLRIPQMFRAIVSHMDRTLHDYMWNFVEKQWSTLEHIAGKPEFLRVLLRRLAASLSRDGLDPVIQGVFGADHASAVASDKVHPAEMFIMPPVDGKTPRLGDVRVRLMNGSSEYVVVLWPTCDMIEGPSRPAKVQSVQSVQCAIAGMLDAADEMKKWKKDKANKDCRAKVEDLLRNRNDRGPGRHHYIPGLGKLPHLLVDFQRIELIALADLRGMECIATLASPFAEAIASRYLRYIGRLGTPDLDVAYVMSKL
ncbi:response regulator [Pyxidicoccus trucidator]|uniref:response regulator n=1 Tax=Pyxidicoccus trucidator TaxID=2709662 RepID=UPI0013DB3670|nr:response regulator [Pyxidicoccus trucidator]